jgi:hypothetical protein
MRRHLIIFFCAALALLGAGVALWRFCGQEPAYQGEPLSYWLNQVERGNYCRFGTADALQAIGAPAAQPLMRIMTTTHDVNVRWDARNALASLGVALAGQEQQLRRLQTHPDPALRDHAESLLSCLKLSRLKIALQGTNPLPPGSGGLDHGR